MNLIGINGFKRSGKGETYQAIKDYVLVGNVQEQGFAWKLKILAARSLGFFDATDEECIALMDSFKLEEQAGATFQITYRDPRAAPPYGGPVLHELTGREYLQNLGSWGRKVFGDDFWVDQVLPKPEFLPDVPSDLRTTAELVLAENSLTTRYPGVDTLAITDLRYPNEAARVLALGGEVWEIVRPGQKSDGHDSEQPLPRGLVSRTIHNDGDLTDLYDAVAAAYDDLPC